MSSRGARTEVSTNSLGVELESFRVDVPFLSDAFGEGMNSGLDEQTIRKLTRRLVPYCCLMTMLAYIDRGNLGFAAAKVCESLKLSHTEYGIGASLFFVGYTLAQVPNTLLMRRFGTVRWLAFLLVAWGTTASSLALVQNTTQFYLLRFALGVTEGGCFPAMWYYLSTFFPHKWLSTGIAFLDASIPLSQPISAPLAASLLSLDGLFGMDGWRLLFIVEGLMSLVYGLVLPLFLPKDVDTASFLTTEDKSWLKLNFKDNTSATSSTFVEELKFTLRNWNFWPLMLSGALRYCFANAALYWTTLIVDEMVNGEDEDDDDEEDTCASSKSTVFAAIMLAAIPFSVGAAFSLYLGCVAHKVKNRTKVGGLTTCSASVFLVLWVFTRHFSFIIALASLSLALALDAGPLCFALSVLVDSTDANNKAVTLSVYGTMVSCGGMLGPMLMGFIADEYGYGMGITIMSILPVLSGVSLLCVNDPLDEVSSLMTR